MKDKPNTMNTNLSANATNPNPRNLDPPSGGEDEVNAAGQLDRTLEEPTRESNQLHSSLDVDHTTPREQVTQTPPTLMSQQPEESLPGSTPGITNQPDAHTQDYLPETDHTTQPYRTRLHRPEVPQNREPADHTPAGRRSRPGNKRTKAYLNIFTLNMNGGGSTNTERKWEHINQIVRDQKLGIGALQETHLSPERVEQLENKYTRLKLFNSRDPERPNAKGVVICVNRLLMRAAEAKEIELIPGRALLVQIPWSNLGTNLNILGIYAPNIAREQIEFWETLEVKLRELGSGLAPDILLGDFNVVENQIDRLPPHKDHQGVVDRLQILRERYNLVDQWRHENPTTKEFTYKQATTDRPSHSRIDRMYLNPQMAQNCYDWDMIHPGIDSDHKLLKVKIKIPKMPYIGPGRWAFPTFLLRDREAIRCFKQIGHQAEEALQKGELNAQQIHKTFKSEIQLKARSMAKKKVPKIRAAIDKKRNELKDILNNHEDNTIPDTIQIANREQTLLRAGQLEEELKELYKLTHNDKRETLSAKFSREAETISKSWIEANKTRKPRDTLYKIKIPGTTPPRYATKSHDMANVAAEYHDNLQDQEIPDEAPAAREEVIDKCLDTLKVRLTDEDKEKMTPKTTRAEIERAIRDLPNGKSPGTDGLPRELYMELMEEHYRDIKNRENGLLPEEEDHTFDITQYLTTIFEDVQQNGTGSESGFADGWMCPIYKKKDKTDISNYRPITVLNTDYKILTRALTTRLGLVVNGIIHKDQAGFMKGRHIEHHTDLVHLLSHLCDAREEEGAIVCLDQEKAYDKIRHDFLWKTLERFNFPIEFITTVKHLYQEAETSVIINGETSNKFKIKRGVRQGDPLSCLLFNLAIESLAESLRSSPLKGISTQDNERLIASLFADDTTVYMSKDDSIETLFEILNNWCKASGARFNVQKTEIIPLGSQIQRETFKSNRKFANSPTTIDPNINIAGDGEAIRVLGAWMGHDIDNDAIWDKVVDEINATLHKWERGHPTQEGRRLVINMYVAGKTQYLTRVQGMPENIEKRLERIIKNFMWGTDKSGFSPPVRTTILQKNKDCGGRKVVDIKTRNEAIELRKIQAYLGPKETQPAGTPLLNEILSLSVPGSAKSKDPLARVNVFEQNWEHGKRNKKSIPKLFRNTMKTIKKVNMTISAPVISHEVKLTRPIWYHPGLDPKKRLPTEGKTASKCLRGCHKIKSVGDMLHLTQMIPPENHENSNECECTMCMKIENETGCQTPHKCRQLASRWIEALNSKWNPLEENDEDIENPPTLILREDAELNHTRRADKTPPPTIFEPDVVLRKMEDGYRIFGPAEKDLIPEHIEHPATRTKTPNREQEEADYNPQPILPAKVQVLSTTINENQHQTETKTALWFGPGDQRNQILHVKGEYLNTTLGEIAAVTIAAEICPTEKLTILTQSNKLAHALNKRAKEQERLNFIGTDHPNIIREALAATRARGGCTVFAAGPCDQAKELLEEPNTPTKVKEATEKAERTAFHIEGAQLTQMTQSSLYRGLMEFNEGMKRQKKKHHRNRPTEPTSRTENHTRGTGSPAVDTQDPPTPTIGDNPQTQPHEPHTTTTSYPTEENSADLDEAKNITRKATRKRLDTTRAAIKARTEVNPTDRSIWLSLQNPDITLKIRQFMWLAMHNGQRIGGFWELIRNYEDRKTCNHCNTDETMDHILLECQCSGQELIWKLASEVLERRGVTQPKPTMGDILASGWKKPGRESPDERGKNRLRTIVTTESAYLIWKIRCEWKIGREEDKNKLHTEKEIKNRWIATINLRLRYDCLYTNRKRFRSRAIASGAVINTWKGTLKNEETLPEDWAGTGVLVGIRMAHPEPHTVVRNGISPGDPPQYRPP